MAGTEYVDSVLPKERERLIKEQQFWSGAENALQFENYDDPGDFAHWQFDSWSSPILKDAFHNKDFANLGQGILRREKVDKMLGLDRAMVLLSYTRPHYYELQSQITEQELLRLDAEVSEFSKTISSYSKVI